MSTLPKPGTSAQEFMESWFPKAFAEAAIPEETRRIAVTLGVRLQGEGGGDWLLHLDHGALRVESAPVEAAPFALIQSLEDWRGCLWEGRGGVFGRQAALLFQPDAASRAAATAGVGPARALSPAILAQLQALKGTLRIVVSGADEGDWKVDFKLGEGPTSAEPSTLLSVNAEDAEAMGRGELDPIQAAMTGRLQVSGDMALLIQMQTIQMQAAGTG